MLKALTLCCLVILFSCSPAQDQQNRSAVTDSLTQKLRAAYDQEQIVGFSVAIVNEDATLFKAGMGYADQAAKIQYTENTLQNVGSVSKTLVGIALLKSQELGVLNLDDPIAKYLPFEVYNPNHPNNPITIRHLATHTSTITDNEYYEKRNYVLKDGQVPTYAPAADSDITFNPADSMITMGAYLENVLSPNGKWHNSNDFLTHKPGEIFQYSNVGTCLAAYIIERANGVSFTNFTRKHILKPLQMDDSGWNFGEINFAAHSRLYENSDTALPYYALITYPDGNFITSSNDLAKFLQELIKGYTGKGTLLKPESYKQYFAAALSDQNFVKRNLRNPYSDEYNIGVFIGHSVAGNIGHSGSDPGVASLMFFNQTTGVGKILIINTSITDKKGSEQFYKIYGILNDYEPQF